MPRAAPINRKGRSSKPAAFAARCSRPRVERKRRGGEVRSEGMREKLLEQRLENTMAKLRGVGSKAVIDDHDYLAYQHSASALPAPLPPLSPPGKVRDLGTGLVVLVVDEECKAAHPVGQGRRKRSKEASRGRQVALPDGMSAQGTGYASGDQRKAQSCLANKRGTRDGRKNGKGGGGEAEAEGEERQFSEGFADVRAPCGDIEPPRNGLLAIGLVEHAWGRQVEAGWPAADEQAHPQSLSHACARMPKLAFTLIHCVGGHRHTGRASVLQLRAQQ